MEAASERFSTPIRGIALWSAACLIVYFACCLGLWRSILAKTGNLFVFPLDDPYIHLELARNIASGHYGINLDAPSAPSSSVLWPFLLAPLSRFNTSLTALWLNLLFGALTCVLIGWFVASLSSDAASKWEDYGRRGIAIVALLFTASLPGISFIGMEHTLQILLSGLIAWGVVRSMKNEPVPAIAILAAIFLPSVRYEGLGLSLALAIALVGRRKWKSAIVMLTLSVIPLILFSLYLHHLGLSLLPSSVVIKGALNEKHGHLRQMISSAGKAFTDPEHLPLLALMAVTLGIALKDQTPLRRAALLGVVAAEALHLLIGPFGWFHRYEIAIEFFGMLVILPTLFSSRAVSLPAFALSSLAFVLPSVSYAQLTPDASASTYRQQWQLARFSSKFARGNVAINDLGAVSYMRRNGEKVVDLYGLGSIEAARQKVKTPAWLDNITAREKVSWVMVFPEWFKVPPTTWHLAGTLCLEEPRGVISFSCVRFYSTSLVPIDVADQTFRSFAATLPSEVIGLPAN